MFFPRLGRIESGGSAERTEGIVGSDVLQQMDVTEVTSVTRIIADDVTTKPNDVTEQPAIVLDCQSLYWMFSPELKKMIF